MIHVRLITAQNLGEKVERRVAGEIHADGAALRMAPENVLPTTLQVLSLRTGEPLIAADDPEEWVRSLPASLRGVGLAVEVVHDTNPVPELSDDEPDFKLPDEAATKAELAL
jgi:hypothetical protein